MVLGGQRVYVAPNGLVSFTNPEFDGSDIAPGSYLTGFRHFPGNPGYWNFTGVNDGSSGFVLCLNTQGSRAGLYADIPTLNPGTSNCLYRYNVTTTDFTEGTYGAYAYNGTAQNCVGGVCS